MVSVSASSPLPTSRPTLSQRSLWTVIPIGAAFLLVVGAGVLRPQLLLPAVGLAVLVIASALLQRAMQEQTAKRLVPIGLAGGLAVKLTGNSIIVGRLPCCKVEIPLPTVSAHHCRFYRVGSRWYVEDLDSRNGTFVNSRRVRKKKLCVGDKVSIGEFEFRVE